MSADWGVWLYLGYCGSILCLKSKVYNTKTRAGGDRRGECHLLCSPVSCSLSTWYQEAEASGTLPSVFFQELKTIQDSACVEASLVGLWLEIQFLKLYSDDFMSTFVQYPHAYCFPEEQDGPW